MLAEVFKVGLNARIFLTIPFLKAHEDSYAFDAHLTCGGFLTNVMLNFLDWRKCFVLIRDKLDLLGFNNKWCESSRFSMELGSFSYED